MDELRLYCVGMMSRHHLVNKPGGSQSLLSTDEGGATAWTVHHHRETNNQSQSRSHLRFQSSPPQGHVLFLSITSISTGFFVKRTEFFFSFFLVRVQFCAESRSRCKRDHDTSSRAGVAAETGAVRARDRRAVMDAHKETKESGGGGGRGGGRDKKKVSERE